MVHDNHGVWANTKRMKHIHAFQEYIETGESLYATGFAPIFVNLLQWSYQAGREAVTLTLK